MYCNNCGVELTNNQDRFCNNCESKFQDAISIGMIDFEVVDETAESIEAGMSNFETRNSGSFNDSLYTYKKLSQLFKAIKKLLKEWVEYYKYFSSVEVDFYMAVKYKLKEGNKIYLIDKQEHWDEWNEIMNELKTYFDEAQLLLSIVKPNFFQNSEKKRKYKKALNKFQEYAYKYNVLRNMVLENDEIRILDYDN